MKLNFKTVAILLLGGLAGALLLAVMEHLLFQIGVSNRFYFSFVRAIVFSFGISLLLTYTRKDTDHPLKWNKDLMLRVMLSIVIITAVDLLI